MRISSNFKCDILSLSPNSLGCLLWHLSPHAEQYSTVCRQQNLQDARMGCLTQGVQTAFRSVDAVRVDLA